MLALIDATSALRPTSRDWFTSLLFATMNWAADLACLLAACRAIGVSGATLQVAGVAYIAGMSVSGISLLPGGLGLVEAAMILTLSHGGLPRSGAIAAVLLYRAISYGLVVAIGWTLQIINTRRVDRVTVGIQPPVELASTLRPAMLRRIRNDRLCRDRMLARGCESRAVRGAASLTAPGKKTSSAPRRHGPARRRRPRVG
jgi:hypothetical protein